MGRRRQRKYANMINAIENADFPTLLEPERLKSWFEFMRESTSDRLVLGLLIEGRDRLRRFQWTLWADYHVEERTMESTTLCLHALYIPDKKEKLTVRPDDEELVGASVFVAPLRNS